MNLPSALSLNQITPAPDTWDPVFCLGPKKPSAVLILFVTPDHDSGEAKVLLIRRSTRVGSHKGQIGFPGGRIESGDGSPSVTALRETEEELGINRALIAVQGVLPSTPALDGSLVVPVIGVIAESQCEVRPNPVEVQSVHSVSWQLLAQGNRLKFSFNMFGCWRDSFLYDCRDITVWGLSAEILSRAAF